MPLIRKKIESKEIDFNGTKTLVIDSSKQTNEINRANDIFDVSATDIVKLKGDNNLNDYYDLVINENVEYFESIKNLINSVQEFYKKVEQRTSIELAFLSKYYNNEVSDPVSFELIIRNHARSFESWFKNHVQYTVLEKLKNFYINIAFDLAKVSPVVIYETDIIANAKKTIEKIKETKLKDLRKFLKEKFDKSLKNYDEVYEPKMKAKKETRFF